MHQQVIIPRREPLWRPGFDNESYERSRIITPARYRKLPQRAAISLVDSTVAQSADAANVTTSNRDTTGAVLLVLFCAIFAVATIPTPTDNKSNTWTALTLHGPGLTSNRTQIFYSVNPTVGSGHTFTLSSTSFPSIGMFALAGSNTSSPFDVENGNGTSSAASLNTGSVTPSEDNEILIYGVGGLTTSTYSVDIGTIDAQAALASGLAVSIAIAHQIQTTATARNPTFSWTGASSAGTSIATFKAAAATGSPLFRYSLLSGLGSGGPFFHNPLG